MSKILDHEVDLIDNLDSTKVFNGSSDIQILENIRFFEGEKSNCNKLGKSLSSLGDIYVLMLLVHLIENNLQLIQQLLTPIYLVRGYC